jgi:hypothetical protein
MFGRGVRERERERKELTCSICLGAGIRWCWWNIIFIQYLIYHNDFAPEEIKTQNLMTHPSTPGVWY